jgi:hypothetical protein
LSSGSRTTERGGRGFLRDNSLSIFFATLLLLTLVGQAITGWKAFNEEQLAHDESTVSLGRFLTSSSFGEAVMENWESEFLQFALFIVAGIFFVQRGSTESKQPEDAGRMSDESQMIGPHARRNSPLWAKVGGLRTKLYSYSLLIVMGAIFVGAWFAHSVTGWSQYSADQIAHGEGRVSWLEFLGTPDFWEQSFQNWQSEFLAVGAMAIFSVYLRTRGTTQSKPVGAPHGQTGSESE